MKRLLLTFTAIGSITCSSFAAESLKYSNFRGAIEEFETQKKQIEQDEKTLSELQAALPYLRREESYIRQKRNLFALITTVELAYTGGLLYTKFKIRPQNSLGVVNELVIQGASILAGVLIYETYYDSKKANKLSAQIELNEKNIAQLNKNIEKALKELAKKKALLETAKNEFLN